MRDNEIVSLENSTVKRLNSMNFQSKVITFVSSVIILFDEKGSNMMIICFHHLKSGIISMRVPLRTILTEWQDKFPLRHTEKTF